MARLLLDEVSVRYGATDAVDRVSLSLDEGLIGCLVGPSGCGKTSVLRAIAGFEPVASGRIELGRTLAGEPGWGLAPQERSVGMLFQDFALFPHHTVAGNVGFGLRRWTRRERAARVDELLELVGLQGLGPRYPHELSGGQQQRAALARAMAPRPQVLLLDEPFSSQDVDRRAQLAQEVRQILRREHVTALLVTHDQQEAFAMADRIGVMDSGHLHQWADPYSLYHRPADRFVADFIGHGTLIRGRVVDGGQVDTGLGRLRGELSQPLEPGRSVYLLVRPDDVVHDERSDLTAMVSHRVFRGADFLYTLRLDDGESVLCLSPSHHDHPIGERIGIRPALEHLVIFAGDEAEEATPSA